MKRKNLLIFHGILDFEKSDAKYKIVIKDFVPKKKKKKVLKMENENKLLLRNIIQNKLRSTTFRLKIKIH